MSVTFTIAGSHADWDDPATHLNLANMNAAELLRWLDIDAQDDLYGEISARELAARCRRRLWGVARNYDPERVAHVDAKPGRATAIWPGRRPGYLREKTAELLALAERAGEGAVHWA